MSAYLLEIEQRRQRESPDVLLWELEQAFAEALAEGRQSAHANELHALLRFCQFDSIATCLAQARDVLQEALKFARRCGAEVVARILAAALDGKPQPPASFFAELPGRPAHELKVDAGEVTCFEGKDWGGTDIALSFAMDGFQQALLDAVIEAAPQLAVGPPRRVLERQARDALLEGQAAAHGAANLLQQLLRGARPRMLAGPCEDSDTPDEAQAQEISVMHRAAAPAAAEALRQARQHYGPAAEALLEVYSLHDGAELFIAGEECGFWLAPMAHWPELLGQAIEWAEQVTWQDEPEEIPPELRSAIAFGLVPGDSERWLLITEGEHAGCILLSDTDLIDSTPRFASVAEFFAALCFDAARVLGCGGYVSYEREGRQLYPIRYLYD